MSDHFWKNPLKKTIYTLLTLEVIGFATGAMNLYINITIYYKKVHDISASFRVKHCLRLPLHKPLKRFQ